MNIKEIKHVLINDYKIPEVDHDLLLAECCNSYGLAFDIFDLELWEVLLSEIKSVADKPITSTVHKIENIKTESKELIQKREVKQQDKKDTQIRYIKKKSRSTLRIKTNNVSNASVSENIATKAVITDIGDGFLYNVDRSYGLHFIKGKCYLIRKKQKHTEPIKIGYFLTYSPTYTFQTSIPYTDLTYGEIVMLTEFFNMLANDHTMPKMIDLRYFLEMTKPENDIKHDNEIRYHTFCQWFSTQSLKSIENWLSKKVRRKRKDIITSNYHTNGQPIKERIWQIWLQYNT